MRGEKHLAGYLPLYHIREMLAFGGKVAQELTEFPHIDGNAIDDAFTIAINKHGHFIKEPTELDQIQGHIKQGCPQLHQRNRVAPFLPIGGRQPGKVAHPSNKVNTERNESMGKAAGATPEKAVGAILPAAPARAGYR